MRTRAADDDAFIAERIKALRTQANYVRASQCDCPTSIDPKSGDPVPVHQLGCLNYVQQYENGLYCMRWPLAPVRVQSSPLPWSASQSASHDHKFPFPQSRPTVSLQAHDPLSVGQRVPYTVGRGLQT